MFRFLLYLFCLGIKRIFYRFDFYSFSLLLNFSFEFFILFLSFYLSVRMYMHFEPSISHSNQIWRVFFFYLANSTQTLANVFFALIFQRHIVYSMDFTKRFSDANATAIIAVCRATFWLQSMFICYFGVAVTIGVGCCRNRYPLGTISGSSRFTLNFLHYHIDICLVIFLLLWQQWNKFY